MLTSDDDWPAVVQNLRKAWKKWARLLRVLRKEGALRHQDRSMLRWWCRKSFYNQRVVRRLMWQQPQKSSDGRRWRGRAYRRWRPMLTAVT